MHNKITKKGRKIALGLASVFMVSGFTGCGQDWSNQPFTNELLPLDGFENSNLKAIAILKFDTGAVKEKGVDTVELRDSFAFDLAKSVYQQKKLRVIEGEIIKSVSEKETLERVKGDFSAATTTVSRDVTYEYNPFQKVDALLTGKIQRYKRVDTRNRSRNYIEVLIKLIDSVDGTVFWITRLSGSYGDVVYTISHTLSTKVFTPPSRTSSDQ